MIRVLVVDDSLVIRGMIRQILKREDDIEIISTSTNGLEAVENYKSYRPDIVLMDIEMPEMNGIDAVRRIINDDKKAKIIMCSTLTHKGAEITIEAMEAGATDYIAKPTADDPKDGPLSFPVQLVTKIRQISGKGTGPKISHERLPADPTNIKTTLVESAKVFATEDKPVTTRLIPPNFKTPKAIAIGSSTGGLEPIFSVLKELASDLTVPVFITQHMPATFTKILAQHIRDRTGLDAHEAADGMVVKNGTVYVAQGGKHLSVSKKGDDVICNLLDTPPENYCKPSADPMFRSVLEVYKSQIIVVVLTGMGNDGLIGARQLVEGGNNILFAQDKTTSVVWGMPGAVAKAGLCHGIMPPDGIGKKIAGLLKA